MYTTNPTAERVRVAVIGGGAAGCMAASAAAENGAEVTVFERNGEKHLCRKLGITGKGRCNLTNACARDVFMENVPVNPRFLFAAFSQFPPEAVCEWFEAAGVPVKTERGNRVFPVSDRAGDVVGALKKAVHAAGCSVRGEYVSELVRCDDGFSVNGSAERFDKAIVACGGMSYQLTGSDGAGYRLAESLGHTVISPRASLVPLTCAGTLCQSLQGLSLRNVSLKIRKKEGGKPVFEDFGEMLFTHFGLSGPMVLSASSAVKGLENGGYVAEIDMKPALDEKTLDARLLREFSGAENRNLSNVIDSLLPRKFVDPFIELSGIPAGIKVNSITREQRHEIIRLLKHVTLDITGVRPINEAIITSGGVSVKEIDPKTMESKLVPGLYFAGEIIDVDAYTGGFNLQIAWSTGRLAGLSAAGGAPVKREKNKGQSKESGDGAGDAPAAEDTDMNKKIVNIAIDGPSGAGKSTLAKAIAGRLGLHCVDTGAIYRTVGFAARERGTDPDDPSAVAAMLPELDLRIVFENGVQHNILDGEDLGNRIRENEISTYASKVSAIPAVREFLLETQRRVARENSVVMDGRDIGTVILPDADVKIFLVASDEDRAQRRYLELIEKGMPESYEKILSDIRERDERDSSRDVAPLKPADDAVLLNNSGITLEQLIENGLEIVYGKIPELRG